MANNTTLNAGTGGDIIQTVDNTTYKTPVTVIGNSTGTNFASVTTANELLVRENNQSATGTLGALNAVVNFGGTLNGSGTVGIAISGTLSGSIQIQGSVDGSAFTTLQLYTVNSAPSQVGSITSNGQYVVNAAGFKEVQAKVMSYTSGSAFITMTSTDTPTAVAINTQLPVGSNVIGYVQVSDGTNQASVKAASTAPATTDKSLVVALSPNSTVFQTVTNGTAATNSVLIGGVFNTTPPTLTNGQGSAIQLNSNGYPIVQLSIGTTALINGGIVGTIAVGGSVALNATSLLANPVYAGGTALVGANPTAAGNGARTGVATDKVGRLLTVSNHERTMTGNQQTTITSSVTETTIVTAVAATFLDLTHLSITNGSATATIVTLKDATAGTTRAIWNIPGGGGVVVDYTTPLAQAAVNNNWTITCGTSVASIYINAAFVKNI